MSSDEQRCNPMILRESTIRNQQVAGSTPAGGSIPLIINDLEIQAEARRAADCGNRRAESSLRNIPTRTPLSEELFA
jgi:hypothetical protein